MNPQRALRVTGVIILSLIGVCLFIWVLPPWISPVSRLKAWRFERKLKQTVDPGSLQQWAVNLARRFPYEHEFYVDAQGTNLPPGIARVGRGRPIVTNSDQDGDTFFILGWGRGEPALIVGSPSLVIAIPRATIWKPGIYVVQPYD